MIISQSRKKLLKYLPKKDTGTLRVTGALSSLEHYVYEITGIKFSKLEILTLVRTLTADAHHIWGYLLDNEVQWVRVEVNINGDLTLLYVNEVVGYSMTLFQEDTTYPSLFSVNLRSYQKGDRLSYSTVSHQEFRANESNYMKHKELFQMLHKRKDLLAFHKLLPVPG